MRVLLLAGMLAIIAAIPASAVLETADQKFAAEAAQADMAEQALGTLALQKSSDRDVREFATYLIYDHRTAGARLREIAATEDVVLPEAREPHPHPSMDELARLDGAAFDRAFLKTIVESHAAAAERCREYLAVGRSEPLRRYAAEILPVLQEHLKQAELLRSRIGES